MAVDWIGYNKVDNSRDWTNKERVAADFVVGKLAVATEEGIVVVAALVVFCQLLAQIQWTLFGWNLVVPSDSFVS